MSPLRLAVLTPLAALALLPPVRAEVPMPVYPDCGVPYAPENCPNDMGNNWERISYIPLHSVDSVREAELELGSGASLDKALAHSAGSWDVIVAIGDSGILWDERDLANKIHLNTGELPLPQDANGDEAASHDLDGNGLVNIRDYAQDPRVSVEAGRDRADHMLDASDLIYTFSDGVDADGNGYTDDIAGWDFFAGDNDAFSDLDSDLGTHGTGVLRDAGAEGNDGGRLGTCPNCALLPIRVGDTFVTDGTRAGQGVAFAVDSGASVMGMAIGALSHPASTTQALEYARQSGVVVVAAAGDENAYHHNMPAMYGDVLYVHSVRANNIGEDSGGVYSFTNFFNCNNYGPRTDLVAGSHACATGAVALIAGATGLVKSAAQERGVELSAEELRQLMTVNVDDIWLTPEETEEANTYPSSEGWDPFYGYGRLNVGAAVQAVVDGDIPPVARFAGPEWFDYVDPDTQTTLTLDMELGAPRADGFEWSLVWGQGWEPTTWASLDQGSGEGGAEALSVDFDPRRVLSVPITPPEFSETTLGRVEKLHRPAVTFKLTVTDDLGREAVARRTVFVYRDPDLLPGFPVRFDSSLESSPQVADLDGDGVYELIVASASGEVTVLTGSGQPLAGWPVFTDLVDDLEAVGSSAAYAGPVAQQREGVAATTAVGDLDGDGAPEVVAAGLEGNVYVWHADGTLAEGFPVRIDGREPEEFDRNRSYDNGVIAAPTLLDINGDGALELLIAGMDSRLYLFDGSGAILAPYPIEVCHPENCGQLGSRIVSSTAVGDIDGDGDPDIVVGSNETANGGNQSVTHAFDALTGQTLPGWPLAEAGLVSEAAVLPIVGEGHPGSPGLVDVDGDGDLEILNPVMLGQVGLIDHMGQEVLDLPYTADGYGSESNAAEPSFVPLANSPAFGDIDLDGTPDLFLGGSGTYALVGLALTRAVDFQHALGGWSGATGASLTGWPRQVEDLQFLMAPTIAELSGDDLPEVIYGSAGYLVHAWDHLGNSPSGWPKFTGQWLLGSPAVADIDGDGYVDVVATTREGFVYAWSTQGRADQAPLWASLHHDPQNTGNAQVVLPAQAGPEEVEGKPCGCASGAGGAGGGLALLLAGLVVGRRRG